MQNLPQNHISTLEQARELVKMGCFDMVESIYGNTPDVLSQLIRTMLIPRDGCEFIVSDLQISFQSHDSMNTWSMGQTVSDKRKERRPMKEKKQDSSVRATVGGRQLLLGVVTLAVMTAVFAAGLSPRKNAEMDTAQVRTDDAMHLDAACQVVQTLHFLPCGHTLTRRQSLPTELAGKGREEAEAIYRDYQVVGFSATELTMERSLELFCPEHVVLKPDETGQLCVYQNRYGESMALLHELEITTTSLPASYQEEIRPGKAFSNVQELETWLESVES